MTLMLSVSGCRGIVGETLTPEVIARFAGAYGSFLRERARGKRVTVVMGVDGRVGNHMVAAAAQAGLNGSGCHVVFLGTAMTPTVAAATDTYARGSGDTMTAGMVLTASHNPQQWNGLKCLLAEGGDHGSAACAPPANLAHQIIDRFKNGPILNATWDGLGSLSYDHSQSSEHIRRVLAAMSASGLTRDPTAIASGLKVAVDCVNASASRVSPNFLRAIGVEHVQECFTDPSGLFPHPPEPTEENLTLPSGLCDAVRHSGADVGFAQDPDADRLAIIDERGHYIGEEYTLALGAMALLEANAQAGANRVDSPVLVTNLSTSRMLEDVAAKYGARVIRTPVGEANVVEAMKREHAIAGGEGNGGVIWPRVTYVRDSLSAMGLVLWLLSPNGAGKGTMRRLSEIVASMPRYAIQKRKVDLKRREDALPAIEKVAAALRAHKVDLSDGVRVDFTSGPNAGQAWIHVRASNTEPIMRLIAEAPTKAAADAILDEAARVIAG